MSIIFFSAFSIFIFLYSKYKYNLKGFLMNRCVYLLYAYKCETILSLFKHTQKKSLLLYIWLWYETWKDFILFFIMPFLKEEITWRVARGKIFFLSCVFFLFDLLSVNLFALLFFVSLYYRSTMWARWICKYNIYSYSKQN